MKSDSKSNIWFTFVGVILLLIGIYAAVRTGINFLAFSKYPQSGVLTLSFFGNMPPSYTREQDCTYTHYYYDVDGKTARQPTKEEAAQEKRDETNCLTSVVESRETAKINDISQSLFFLFLGAGVLVARKILLR